MAFNADKYRDAIVKQIAGNFSDLEDAVKHCPDLEKAIKEYRNLQNKDDFFIFKKPSELQLREAETKATLYQQNIGDLVCDDYRTVEPLNVGLFGEWGSGKTHLLKLIESRINQLQSNPLKDEKDIFPHTTIPVFFNAWRFEKEEHLIIPLFKTMLAELEGYEHFSFKDKSKKLSKKTWELFKVLGVSLAQGLEVPKDPMASLAKVASGELSEAAALVNTEKVKENAKTNIEKHNKEKNYELKLENLLSSDHLEAIYYQIPQWIEKITLYENVNFVFLIDDLDRCLPENTLKMLESIKLFLDVPSCAFVLAIDDDVVERGVAYHYRDYLQQNNNVIINLEKKEEETQKKETQELPITGHEYLEKMIQLPFRIPVIGTDNVYDFLEERYRDTFEMILKENELKKETRQNYKEMGAEKGQQSQTDMILDFFSKTIPPKPRKIKRTAMLFETKVELLDSLGIELRPKLIAKMILLELFAPKLLRFIQNNGYVRMYDRLVHFKSLENPKSKEEEKEKLTLADVVEIREHIDSVEAKYDTKEREIYHKLMDIVTENRRSRMIFDLDAIFDTAETKENLQLNIELMKPKEKKVQQTVSRLTHLSESSLEKLFRPNDAASWADAFRDNKALADAEALLSNDELTMIIDLAKKKEEFAKDPEWMGIVATYISNEQYTHLLKELYDYRFADINGKFKMGIYQVTFAEYDRYCQVKGLEKPKDEEWGRGKRPVINVSWKEATAYASWLSDELGVTYKLPNEEDWYLACNNGKTTQWHFGDDEKELKEYAWYTDNSEGKTHPVGEKKPNELGLYDMHGNVWEWCENWYDDSKDSKVLRGGSWNSNPINTRSANRYWINPANHGFSIGFRLQRTLP